MIRPLEQIASEYLIGIGLACIVSVIWTVYRGICSCGSLRFTRRGGER
jgi:hypothetical protein